MTNRNAVDLQLSMLVLPASLPLPPFATWVSDLTAIPILSSHYLYGILTGMKDKIKSIRIVLNKKNSKIVKFVPFLLI